MLRTRDTVLWETSAASAMSRIVATERRTAGGAGGGGGGSFCPGASSGFDREPRAGDISARLTRIRLHSG
ncbi:hypothetical protein GCM10023263_39470 [Phytohabitans rumicis]